MLDGCRVPEADRLAGANTFKDTAAILRRTRSGVAWQAVGVMLAAYEIARDYAVEREQFGRPIAKFQLVQDLLVRMLGNATASLGMVVRLAQLQDGGLYRDEHSALAKAYCTTRMREVVGWARELMAATGSSSTTASGGSSPTPGALLLRGHPGDQHADRRARRDRPGAFV